MCTVSSGMSSSSSSGMSSGSASRPVFRGRFLPGVAALAVVVACGSVATAPVHAAGVTGFTTGSDLAVRSSPSTNASILTRIAESGTRITVQCQTRGQSVDGTYDTNWWAKVTVNGRTGYVSRAFVRIPDATGMRDCDGSPPAPPRPDDEVEDYPAFRARAYDWINRRVTYNWDATARAWNGKNYRRDCSGFVSMVFGLSTSRSTVNMLTAGGFRTIPFSQLKKGDIVGNFGPGSAGSAGHVVVFNGWANADRTRFHTLEMHGGNSRGLPATASTASTSSSWVKTAARYVGP